jgi:hypothetical protein
MADPTIEDLAVTIIQAALTDTAEREANIKKNNIGTSWISALDSPLDEVLKKLS